MKCDASNMNVAAEKLQCGSFRHIDKKKNTFNKISVINLASYKIVLNKD